MTIFYIPKKPLIRFSFIPGIIKINSPIRNFRSMKGHILLCLFIMTSSFVAVAQEIELPRLSPKASVSYTIGMTDVKVTYGAPAVKERIIWGNLVPYDKVWRAGANEATTVEFST